MTTTFATITELLENDNGPFPVSLIPNNMGINLCAVKGISWTRQEDGQLVNVQIHFIPESNRPTDTEVEEKV